ncbi:hypothetical protein N7495_000437 [Penicillium taxi]|uniref:uncharacterized protein n=1 Tax=Penicillium taxi TaxID=168475 RepID=UPI00254531A4|nr:uncharacterized protein N7495_000437 [Penicillium taxi]KAJ5907755.1 hypothetical protein N7495_000437 [Penicillium taxi]
MAVKQDTTSISAAAETHIASYCATLLSPDSKTSIERATKMATYYLPNSSFSTEERLIQLSDPSTIMPLIAGVLDRAGRLPEVIGHRVEAVGENSAIIWLSLKVDQLDISNVYVYRRTADGAAGFEGGIFDGEMWIIKNLNK